MMTPLSSLPEILAKAVALHQSGAISQAHVLYQYILIQDPVHPDALHLYGVLKRREAGPECGIQWLRRALVVDAAMDVARLNLGNTLLTLNRIDELRQELLVILRGQPDHLLALRYLAVGLLSDKRFDEARPYVESLFRLEPDSQENRKLLEVVYHGRPVIDGGMVLLQQAVEHEQAGRLQDAEMLYRQVLRMDPARFDALRLLAGLALRTGRRPLGEYLVARARALYPTRHI